MLPCIQQNQLFHYIKFQTLKIIHIRVGPVNVDRFNDTIAKDNYIEEKVPSMHLMDE